MLECCSCYIFWGGLLTLLCYVVLYFRYTNTICVFNNDEIRPIMDWLHAINTRVTFSKSLPHVFQVQLTMFERARMWYIFRKKFIYLSKDSKHYLLAFPY